MKPLTSFAALGLSVLLFAVLLGTARPSQADEGHEHGVAQPAAAGQALPRFAAVSEAFELLGVLDGRQLTLYLDRFADNTPVVGAQIELDISGVRYKAQAQGDDAYQLLLNDVPQPGVLAITATVAVGAQVDRLAAELDLHAADPADEADHAPAWPRYAGWAAGGLLALAMGFLGLSWALRRRRLASPHSIAGAA